MARTLVLRRELLTPLSPADLAGLAGAAPSGLTCETNRAECVLGDPPTYGWCDTKVPTRCLCP